MSEEIVTYSSTELKIKGYLVYSIPNLAIMHFHVCTHIIANLSDFCQLTPFLQKDPDDIKPEEEDEDDEADLRVVHRPGDVILRRLDCA